MMVASADPWEAFGSDDEEQEDGDEQDFTGESTAAFLVSHFLRSNPQVTLSQRHVCCELASVRELLEARQIKTSSELQGRYDALIISNLHGTSSWDTWESHLVPGGYLLIATPVVDLKFDSLRWRLVPDEDACTVIQKRACRVQQETCPWLPSRHDLQAELTRAAEATIAVTVHEESARSLTEYSIDRAVQAMQKYGYCVIPNLLDPSLGLKWGNAVLDDLQSACEILLAREQVDLVNPRGSKQEPGSYRELSMREDFRMDLRSGPKLTELREQPGIRTVKSNEELSNETGDFLRGHKDILEIVRRTMNPVDPELSPGNFGRYNFDGSGPDGSFQDLRIGPVGGIVSLPGAAEQALHADTPHLFETYPALPAHYINVFTPGAYAHEGVGQTAFIHGSHDLRFTAKYCSNNQEQSELWKFLVRPRIDVGDVLLFDCRILHFGLANHSAAIQRPLLYANMTMHWFNDPKNWDNERPIFTTSTQ